MAATLALDWIANNRQIMSRSWLGVLKGNTNFGRRPSATNPGDNMAAVLSTRRSQDETLDPPIHSQHNNKNRTSIDSYSSRRKVKQLPVKLRIDGVSRVTCRHPRSQGLGRGASAHFVTREWGTPPTRLLVRKEREEMCTLKGYIKRHLLPEASQKKKGAVIQNGPVSQRVSVSVGLYLVERRTCGGLAAVSNTFTVSRILTNTWRRIDYRREAPSDKLKTHKKVNYGQTLIKSPILISEMEQIND
uniref:Uncharacterized protein n=1 Tax=Timema poppense TaxID=170557 RepID=A0A7R9DTI1_TIMPO|nr:unnamed protein product [Timema poppensis]